MTEVHESEVDGVPCFWVDTGRPTLAARLMFRQGMADEPLHESGWLHLLEHMVLHGSEGGALQVNGSVSPLLTSFDVHGPVGSVVDHLNRVTAWLGSPKLERAEHERGVLRAESELRGGSLGEALRWRYGAQGPGTGSYGEPGLVRATPERLWDRCTRVFNRGNAVLVLDGPPPTRLRLDLANGSFLPSTPAVGIEWAFPLAYEEPRGLVITGAVRRSTEATIAAALLEKALRKEVRDRSAAAYAPWSSYEPVDRDMALIAAGSDLLSDVLPTILDRTLVMLGRLQAGAPMAWLDEIVDARLQALHDPYHAFGIAMRAGQAVLNEELPPTFDQLVTETEETDREQVRAVFDELRSSVLLGAPGSSKLPKGLKRASWERTLPWRDERGHRHTNWPRNRSRFSVGHRGVQVATGKEAAQVPLPEVAALVTRPDGTRHVIGRDGWSLTFTPGEWHGARHLASDLDRIVDEELHLPLTGSDGTPFRRLPWHRRWLPQLDATFSSGPGLALLAVVLSVTGVLLAAGRHPLIGGILVVVAAVCLLRVPRAYLRGRRRLW